MDGQERFIAAMRCEEVDKLPCHWMGYEPAGVFRKEFEAFLNQDENPELEACFEIWPIGDITIANWFSRGTSTDVGLGAGGIHFPVVYYNRDKDTFYTKKEAESLTAEQKQFQITMYGDVRQYGYKFGSEGERLSDYWWFIKHWFEGPEGLERMDAFYNEFGAPWEQEFDPDAPSIKSAKKTLKLAEEYGFRHAVVGHAPMHFEGIWGGFGPIGVAQLARKKPSKLHEICKKFENVSLITEQYCLEAGLKIIGTGDDLGQKDRSLVSPKLYREFFYPALKARCDLAHKYDAVVYMHSCGFIEELLDHMIDAGLDAIQSLEVPAGNDLGRIRAKVRDKMCLIGGIDSSRVMSFGRPADCEAHVKEQIAKATTLDGEKFFTGYIPGAAHNLLDTPLVNVQSTIAAIGKYCKKS
jgi:hypothetical protein